jgi:hypothetical protein
MSSKDAEHFELTQLQMSDKELIERCYKEIHELARTDGKSHRMTIPPSPNDTDMLLSQIVGRFEKLLEKVELVEQNLNSKQMTFRIEAIGIIKQQIEELHIELGDL